jgi:aldehyde:ferredoxin oxidoreductase
MGTALGYAVSPRGGDFTSIYATAEYRWSPERAQRELGNPEAVNRFSPEGKAALIKRSLIVSAVLDSLGLCKVPVLTLMVDFGLKNEAALMASLTGWKVNSEDLMRIGEKIINVERLFNLRCGAGPGDDVISERFSEEAIAEGPAKGYTVQVEPMVKDFYQAMGWNEAGYPSPEGLEVLDLLPDRQMIRRRKVKVGRGRHKMSQANLPATNRAVTNDKDKEWNRARRIR